MVRKAVQHQRRNKQTEIYVWKVPDPAHILFCALRLCVIMIYVIEMLPLLVLYGHITTFCILLGFVHGQPQK